MFHRHNWQDVSWTYTPPYELEVTGITRISGAHARQLMSAVRASLEGKTIVIQRCSKCNEVTSRSFFGRATADTAPAVEPIC